MLVRSAFYDMPLSTVAEAIVASGIGSDRLTDAITDNLRWADTAFTATDALKLKELLKDWLGSDHLRCPGLLLKLLPKYSDEIIDANGAEPRVRFNRLLRWRRMSLMVGEDALVMPLMAKSVKSNFAWPDTLETDNAMLNSLFRQGLADTHAHLHATTCTEAFNWLNLCNYPGSAIHSSPKVLGKGFIQNYDHLSRLSAYDMPLIEWALIAVSIRVRLYEWLKGSTYSSEHRDKLRNALTDKIARKRLFRDTECSVKVMQRCAPKTATGFVPDYALQHADISSSPYAILAGERRLLYEAFQRYWQGDTEAQLWSPWLYLYLLIKTKFRREIIQTNPLHGFGNFKTYQDRKSKLLHPQYQLLADRYAVQTSLGTNAANHLEARITADDIRKNAAKDLIKPIFGNTPSCDAANLTFVVHFIKNDGGTHKKRRRVCQQDLARLIRLNDKCRPIGLDAAGSEINCPPEVFAPVYRKARAAGFTNFTYHVGEDFHDLLSGLRAIDEAIRMLGLGAGCRIGHALALGTDVRQYYEDRHLTMLLSKQMLLDNLVWLKYRSGYYNIRLSAKTHTLIDERSAALIGEIGYPTDTSLSRYWMSMQLRGDDYTTEIPAPTAIKHGQEYSKTWEQARSLLDCYLLSPEIRKKGVEIIKLKIDQSLADDIRQLQEAIIADIERSGIFIEACPSSNCKIGITPRYDSLPMLRYCSPDPVSGHHIPTSINTDDRGIFATSLHNEFSLMACALHKAKTHDGQPKYTDRQIYDYLSRIAEYGRISRFRKTD